MNKHQKQQNRGHPVAGSVWAMFELGLLKITKLKQQNLQTTWKTEMRRFYAGRICTFNEGRLYYKGGMWWTVNMFFLFCFVKHLAREFCLPPVNKQWLN